MATLAEGKSWGDDKVYVAFTFTYTDHELSIREQSIDRLPRPRGDDPMIGFADDERSAAMWRQASEDARCAADRRLEQWLRECRREDTRREWDDGMSTLKKMLHIADLDLKNTGPEGEPSSRNAVSVDRSGQNTGNGVH